MRRGGVSSNPRRTNCTSLLIAPTPGKRSRPELSGEVTSLEASLDGAQEPRGLGAVDQPVVVRQRQVHHVADRDDLSELVVIDHHRPLDQRTGAEAARFLSSVKARLEAGDFTAELGA